MAQCQLVRPRTARNNAGLDRNRRNSTTTSTTDNIPPSPSPTMETPYCFRRLYCVPHTPCSFGPGTRVLEGWEPLSCILYILCINLILNTSISLRNFVYLSPILYCLHQVVLYHHRLSNYGHSSFKFIHKNMWSTEVFSFVWVQKWVWITHCSGVLFWENFG